MVVACPGLVGTGHGGKRANIILTLDSLWSCHREDQYDLLHMNKNRPYKFNH